MNSVLCRRILTAACLVSGAIVSGISATAADQAAKVNVPQKVETQGERARSPEALAELFRRRDALKIELISIRSRDPKPLEDQLAKLDAEIDRVGGQRYCSRSRLFWYTDLERAKAEAKRTGKPILSLHLLGKLTDEYSCANSRFFRTALYSNADISKMLRERFVLHWKSVRPVPKVTIEFGDGRKIVRTLTGNSAHYILAADGRPVDVLPGLYGPKEFVRALTTATEIARGYTKAKTAARKEQVLRMSHRFAHAKVVARWGDDLRKMGAKVDAPAKANAAPAKANGRPAKAGSPSAGRAAARAVSKSAVETPLLRLVMRDTSGLEKASTREVWEKIAALHRDEAKLDASSRALVRAHHVVPAERAGALSETKRRAEDPVLRVIRRFEESIALDTVRNEHQLHRKIHQWFADGKAPRELAALNERVYAELFLTPSSDPWLGLNPPDAYTALPGEGLVGPRR